MIRQDDDGDQLLRQESYLEEDSPAVKGAHQILFPPENLFTIPGHELTMETIEQVPSVPRSKVIKDDYHNLGIAGVMDQEEMKRKIEESLKVKKVKEARENMVRKGVMVAPKGGRGAGTRSSKNSSRPRFRHKYMEPKKAPTVGPSISSTARQYLHVQSIGTGRSSISNAERAIKEKVEVVRYDVLGGGTTLDKLRIPHHLPQNPKPSAVRHVDIVVEAHRSPQEIEDERAEAMLRWRGSMLFKGTLASHFALSVNRKFRQIILVHRYEQDEEAMTKIIRLQRWTRHVRLKWVFKHLLKKRRVVYKAVGWWMIGARLRYRRLCGTRIRTFFHACFNEGGFRMAMKTFLFRVVKVQRCIRSFLACHRARISTLCLKLKSMKQSLAEGYFAERTAGVIRYIIECDSYAVNCIIRKYRRPYMNQQAEYRRAIRAGDMTPAFQELDYQKISAFLIAPSVNETPPQYEGDTIRKPILFLYTRMFLQDDFFEIIGKSLPAYLAYERQRAFDEAKRREKKEMEDAMARGEGQAYQLKKMQEHMKQMGNPQDRYDEGVAEILAYYRKRREEDEKERKEAVANKRRSNKKV
jgi:hypothetical protein